MSRLPNPNQNQPFEQFYYDERGNRTHGERIVDGLKEIVDIRSGQSNMNYYLPEKVLDPTGCNHKIEITNVPKREAECIYCHWQIFFRIQDVLEENGKIYIILQKKKYLATVR